MTIHFDDLQDSESVYSFTLPITPTAQERPRFSCRGMAYKSKKQRLHELELDTWLTMYKPAKPIENPCAVVFEAVFPLPKSAPKMMHEHVLRGATPAHGTKPDVDNLIKQLFDGFTRCGFWTDDKICHDVHSQKCYGLTGMWRISILNRDGLDGEFEQLREEVCNV